MTPSIDTRRWRAGIANQAIAIIAGTGRKFFRHGDAVSRLDVDDRGRVWFTDKYTGRRIYTHYTWRWRGFTEGGTLRQFVEALRDYVTGKGAFPMWALGPRPDWVCGGDPWGYGEDMGVVREAIARLVELHRGGQR